ncbi:MAG: glycosyltransferase family 2 protein [Terrimicrobiaceae bacterium]
MSDPAITVLMTVFNAGRFLDPSIRSIINQAFRNFEFLIVDDASTDGSLVVAEEWARQDPRIRVIRNDANKGQTPCLNQGLRLARGKWIARQDADDLSHPVRLSEQHQFTTIHPEVVLLGTNGRIIDEQDRLTGLLDAPLSHEAIEWTSPFLNPFMHTSVLFRADIIRDEFGGYDESFRIAQDYDLWTRVLARHRTANLPQRLVGYRHLESSLSKAGRDRAFAEAEQVSRRQSERVFRRKLEPAEHELLNRFREGLDPANCAAFWTLYHAERRKFEASSSRDLDRTTALHHLKAAGSLVSHDKVSAWREIAAALREDSFSTARWLAERYLNA